MRQAEPVIEDSRSVEDVHHLRLMARLEAGRAAQDEMERASSGGPEPERPNRRYVHPRTYPLLVTREAEPDEDLVYGDATAATVEWRKAHAELMESLKTGRPAPGLRQ